jgi:hypothetical protein
VTKTRAIGVEVLRSSSDKGVGVLGIDVLGSLADDVAVEEGHGLAECDGADDEGDEQERVNASHDEEAEVGMRPVVADADHDVERGNTGLVRVRACRGWFVGVTYDAQCTNELFWRLNTSGDDHLDKVGRDADNKNHAKGLQDANAQEHLAQRHGSVAGDRHIGGLKVVFVGDMV